MSTYHSLHYHIVFSTKHRKPWIKPDWSDRFHQYIGGLIKGLDATPLNVGGVADHIHLLAGCKTTHRPSDFIREIKKSATKWVHEEVPFESFGWQDGYAIFSVSPDACRHVTTYIANQAEHHRTRTFREELTLLLERAGVHYDPKYLD